MHPVNWGHNSGIIQTKKPMLHTIYMVRVTLSQPRVTIHSNSYASNKVRITI